jgi:lipopolysaccharide biosynthesis glycosyltransferase
MLCEHFRASLICCRIPENCAFTIQHSDVEKAQVEGSSMKGCINMLNSGLLVVIPSADAYDMISKKMEDTEAMQKYDFPDQGILSDVFMNRWVVLPYIYNALKTLRWEGIHTAIWRDDKVKNVHYIWSPKPWNQKPDDPKDETDKWWHKVHNGRKEEEKSRGIVDSF